MWSRWNYELEVDCCLQHFGISSNLHPVTLAKPVEAKKYWLRLVKVGQCFVLAQELGLPSFKINYKGKQNWLQLWIALTLVDETTF
jgi:hypothetical protein